MYDNLDSFRAETFDCEVVTEDIEGLGEVTALSKRGVDANIDIYPTDTQASLEPFFGGNGDYFLVSYIGDTPDLVYGYHIEGEHQGDIFSIRDVGSMFAKLLFNPNDDLVTGTIAKPIPVMMITGEAITSIMDDKVRVGAKTMIIQTMIGETGGSEAETFIDILSIVDGRRILLGRSFTDQTVYGTLRKKFNIKLKDNTKILSFSFGNNPTDNGDVADTLKRVEVSMLHELEVDTMYGDNIGAMMKMLDTPNKIYNTEVTI